MLNASQLRGVHVPVITPFRTDGTLDLPSYRAYLTWLLQHRIQGVIVGGTTGESPALSWGEVEQLTLATQGAMNEAGAVLPLTIGTGTNDTATSIHRTERALALGADAVLAVVPYYNRPSPAGILAHYRAIAEVGLPVIAYNIPYRTGVELSTDTVLRILDIPNVIGLKDSSGGIRQLLELSRRTSKPILCGEDAYFHAALCAGAKGGILASSCAFPGELADVYEAVQQGRVPDAKLQFDRLLPLIELLYREPNPAPLKWLLRHRGLIASSSLRLPMTEISPALEQELTNELGDVYLH